MKKRKKGRAARPPMLNAVQVAIDRARVLTADDRALMNGAARQALDDLKVGRECVAAWQTLGGAFNLSEQMSAIGIGVDELTLYSTRCAHRMLGVVLHRFEHLGTWTLRAEEMRAFDEGLLTFDAQLQLVSYGEFMKAKRRSEEIVRQALAGNVGPGVEVLQATKKAA